MAEKQDEKQDEKEDEKQDQKDEKKDETKRRSARDVVRDVRDQVEDLLGRPVDAVLGVQRGEDDDDDWTVTVEVVELRRIPPSTDVIGKYEVTVDGDGDLTGSRRVRRYMRAEGGDDEGGR